MHPHLCPTERRNICEKAKIAPGRGALKPTPRAPTQRTLPSILGSYKDKSGKEGKGQEERENEAGDDVAMAGLEEEAAECSHVNIEEGEEGIADVGTEDDENREVGEEESDKADLVMTGADEWSLDRPFHDVEEVEQSISDVEAADEVREVGEEESDEGDLVDMSYECALDHPFLVDLRQHLSSRHGKGRSEREARQIAVEVAKFLKFAGPLPNPQNLYNPKKLDEYLKQLENQGKKATTQHGILCRVKQGLAYVNLSLDPTETLKAEKCLKLISNWISTLGKEARRAKRVHLEDMADKGPASMTAIDEFCSSPEMRRALSSAVEKSKNGERISPAELRKITIWLAGSLLHSNAQRPGAITNATLSEYKAATVFTMGRKTYSSFMVANHKTATTGRAKITADQLLSGLLQKYVKHLRPQSEGSSSDLLFPNREGHPLDHLSRHVDKLAKTLGIDLPRTATQTRHAAATAIAEGTEVERNAVAVTMSHSPRTQQLYYSLKKGRKEAVEGYRVMEGIRKGDKGRETGGSRKGFSEEETDTIRLYFSDYISSGKVPSSGECKQFLAQHQLARDAKQVRDKVRNIIGRGSK